MCVGGPHRGRGGTKSRSLTLNSEAFVGHRLQRHWRTAQLGRPLLGGLSFLGVSGLCTSSLAQRLPGETQAQGMRRRPRQAWVSCSGVGQLPVIRTLWVAISCCRRHHCKGAVKRCVRRAGQCRTPRDHIEAKVGPKCCVGEEESNKGRRCLEACSSDRRSCPIPISNRTQPLPTLNITLSTPSFGIFVRSTRL